MVEKPASEAAACHPATLSVDELLRDCRVWRQRRSGPGGQHRNKVETAVFIEHVPTGIRAEASEPRSQEQNRREAICRLRVQLAVRVRAAVDAVEDYAPSRLWVLRRNGRRLSVSPDHDDFPAILAEAVDVLAAASFKLPPAATALGTTTSQLAGLLAKVPDALTLVNAERRARGLRLLRP